MADLDSETIRLLFDLGDSKQAVEDMTKHLDALKGSVHTTADTYQVLERQVGEYEVLERRVTEAVKTQVTVYDQLNIDLNKHVDLYHVVTTEAAKTGQTFSRQGAFGSGILSASYAVQDFTSVLSTQGLGRALGAIQNNIPILVASLGAGAGLAGAISIVSIGTGLLIDNWDKLTGKWKDGETEREAGRQKQLAKEMEAAADAAERMAKAHPRVEREEESRLKKAVDEFGGPAVVKELQEALVGKRGSFGAEQDRKNAQEFFSQLMQGNRGAWNYLGDLDLRGDIGEVLRGGMTPKERQAINARRLEKEAKARDQARKEQAEEEEKARKEEAHQAEEKKKGDERVAANRKRLAEQEEAAQAKRLHDRPIDAPKPKMSLREHVVDAEIAEAVRRQLAIAQGHGTRFDHQRLGKVGHDLGSQMPTLEEAMTIQQMAMRQMVSNQASFAQRLKMARALLEQSRKIGEQVQQPLQNGGW